MRETFGEEWDAYAPPRAGSCPASGERRFFAIPLQVATFEPAVERGANMSTACPRRWKRLGELLIEARQIKASQLNEALEHQRDGRVRLGRMLVRLGHLSEEALTLALSRQLNLPVVHLDQAPITPKMTRYLPVDLAERYRAFPLSASAKHRMLRVATSDPPPESELALSQHTGMRVYFLVTGEAALHRAIRRFYHGEKDVTPVHAQFAAQASTGVTQAQLAVEFPHKKLNELEGRMAQLETLVHTQGRALRGMLEMLDEKGVLRRTDVLNQMASAFNGTRPPPLRCTAREGRSCFLSCPASEQRATDAGCASFVSSRRNQHDPTLNATTAPTATIARSAAGERTGGGVPCASRVPCTSGVPCTSEVARAPRGSLINREPQCVGR